MHERINAQVGHGEGHDDWRNESSGADQPLQSRALCFVEAFKGGIEIGITVVHFSICDSTQPSCMLH